MESFSLSSPSDGALELEVYHDERGATNEGWLYHSFLCLPTENKNRVIEKLCDFRKKTDWQEDLHFKDLGSTVAENRLAQLWIDYFCNEGYKDFYFYLFGVNCLNLEKRLWKPPTRGIRIYNKFFQMGLYGALKWFFIKQGNKVNIIQIYSHKKTRGPHDNFRFEPIQEINFKAQLKEEPIDFKSKQIKEIGSDRNETGFDESHVVQFVDIVMGTLGHIYDRETGKRGKDNCASVMLQYGLPKKLMAINPNSRYYKRFAVSFFPKAKLSKDEILNRHKNYYHNHFYSEREIKFGTQNQLLLEM